MKLQKYILWSMITIFGIVFLLSNGKTAEAKKYYSLREIGLAGCTKDYVDYAIISIRGKTLKYVRYQYYGKSYGWKQIGSIKTAKLTSKTKYYMGNSDKVSDAVKNMSQQSNNSSQRKITRAGAAQKRYLPKKVKTIDTEKWIYRVRKGTVKRSVCGRHNEIVVNNGKVIKLAVRLTY